MLMQTRRMITACFSPLVMFLTYAFELCAALWLLLRYKLSFTGGLLIAILINLAVFQLAEWNICDNNAAQIWVRIGFIATALLIPLGFILVDNLFSTPRSRVLIALSGVGALGFITWFGVVPESVQMIYCGGNYALYHIAESGVALYAAYYYGFLSLAIWVMMASMSAMKQSKKRQAMGWLAVGYLSFMVPTLTVSIVNPQAMRGIPSILCGFAVFFALIIVWQIAPLVLVRRK
ncbi:hypothetical protein KBC99_02420 [Candidatus Saccharibacteria bacterium]|nr:hypothetical protein [Candidatus Saccharibacteria bacterium]